MKTLAWLTGISEVVFFGIDVYNRTMIEVILNEANFEYDIYSLLQAFYPHEEIRVRTEATEEEAVSLSFCITYEEHRLAISWEDTSDKSGSVTTVIDYNDRSATKNELKKSLYHILVQLTGHTLPWGTLTGIRPTKIPRKMLDEGKSEAEIRAYLRDTYLISPEKEELSVAIAKKEHALLTPLMETDRYSLYIGIPFCPSTCLYCSFTSYPIGVWKERVADYLQALYREIDYVAEAFAKRRLTTIYIGGGTPTSLSAAELDQLLTKVERSLDLTHLIEYTVEAGRPDSITKEKLCVLRAHGVGRISINPQTMNQKTLDLIGRFHTIEETRESFLLARKVGFDVINMDLIVGLPGERLEDVAHTMEEVKSLAPDNLTVHSLAIKRSARLNLEWDHYKDKQMENSAAHMALAHQTARSLSMEPYYLYRQKNIAGNLENIGFSTAGKEGLYNILIMEEIHDIVALGAGSACKRIIPGAKTDRCENIKDVAGYIARIDEMIDRKRRLYGV